MGVKILLYTFAARKGHMIQLCLDIWMVFEDMNASRLYFSRESRGSNPSRSRNPILLDTLRQCLQHRMGEVP